MTKRPLQGSKRKKVKLSGFRARMKTPCGRSILSNRRRKRRKRIMVI
nr:ribosomal protein L34 [Pyropia sp. Myanmar_A]BED43295.1 ribosomal protein L34 [Pyropia sp. Myanmar_B]BED43492.1 ribosomal protein L34 [Pyropia sp. Myanmar_C]